MWLRKAENIMNLLIIFGGVGYLFVYALEQVVSISNLALSITLMIVSGLFLAYLVFELIMKKSLDAYEKYIDYAMLFLFGLFVAGGWGILPIVFGIIGVILAGLGFLLLVAVLYFRGTTKNE